MHKKLESILKKKADNYAKIDAKDIVYDDKLLEYCQANQCGKYNTNWMCPPVLDSKEYIRRLKKYNHVLVFSKITKLNDSFDVDNMYKGRIKIEKILTCLQKKFGAGYDYMLLGAGACQICDKCSYPHHSCCYPDKAIPSLESVGINVVELANSCKLNYHNGVNTVTYFAAIFYN